MDMLAKIPFSIKLNEGHFKGEALGFSLTDESVFEVRLTNGEIFQIKAVPDFELKRYNWASYINGQWQKIVPIVGRVIERYFKARP